MKKAAIDKARDRLAKAQEALARIGKPTPYPAFVSAWTDLLLAANSVDSILEYGAKTDAKSRQWYGGKKKVRTGDPLLCYMHQARNSDEHGIAPVTEAVGTAVSIGEPGQSVMIQHLEIKGTPQGTTVVFGGATDDAGNAIPLKVRPPHTRLIRVVDERFGTAFDPPGEHLGDTLDDDSPVNVATLWLKYLAGLIDEAEELVR